jgi:Fe-Mn family superoxide dismutase
LPPPDPDRRAILGAGAVAAAAVSPMAASAAPLKPQPRPLGFDPKSVPGLSERLLTSHHAINYTGAAVRLGAIASELAILDLAAAPGYRLNGLKREELIAWNSVILHEAYFAGFGPRERPSVALAQALERDFGSHDRWAAEFAAMGRALGGGSGWVLLTWSRRDRRLVNSWAADHTMSLADGAVLLALDMYEHAYHIDYGAKAGDYVNAFMKAFSWTNANVAFERAQP